MSDNYEQLYHVTFGETADIKRFGNDLNITGAIYGNHKEAYLIWLPDETPVNDTPIVAMKMSLDNWKRLLQQTDLMEVEVLAKAKDGSLTKAIIRKSQRQIDQVVSWRVFKRDGYRCQYCWNDSVPLTVDHLVLWEKGGPSIEENLLSACKPCNKARGNTEYRAWVEGGLFDRGGKLPGYQIAKLRGLVDGLGNIPVKLHVASR